MKQYIKTALVTSLVMLILIGIAGVFIGRAYLANQEEEKAKREEEMDMNLYGSTKVEIAGADVYDLITKGEGKNVQTFSKKGAASIYNVKKSAQIMEELEQMKKKNSYSFETPLWVYNPFGTNKLSLYVYFKTANPYSVKYTIHTEEKDIPDFTRNCYSAGGELLKEHEYQITGLVPGVKNYIFLSLCTENGEVEKQIIYSITPDKPKNAPQVKLSAIEGKSSEKLANGLYVFMGEDIYLYDNSGVLRGIIPMKNSHAVNLLFINNQMIYNFSRNGIAAVNSLGQVEEVYTMDNYQIHEDFTYDGYGHLLVLASHTKADTTGDRIVSVNMGSGKSEELIDFGNILSGMEKKASKGNAEKLNWLNLNSIVMTGSDSVLVSSKELSSLIKVSHLNSERPAVSYILAQDSVWAESDYAGLLYTKAVSEEGDKLFRSQFGQSSLNIVKEPATEQYYITMFNHNYGNSPTRADINWSETEGVGTKKKAASTSKFYQYYIDEGTATYMLTDSFNVPYSTEGSMYTYGTHLVVNAKDTGTLGEYDKDGKLIRGLEYKEKSAPYKVQKQDMKGFWYR